MSKLPLKTLHAVFITFIIIYAVVQFIGYNNYGVHPFITNHVNDIIVIPIIGTIALHVLWLVKRNYELRIGVLSLLSLVILYSVYFEYYLPQHTVRYTGDIWDVVCYSAGAVIFFILQKLP